MKKSKYISLVLISAALASCDRQLRDTGDGEIADGEPKNVYMRSETTEQYDPVYPYYNNMLWYYSFYPSYGVYWGGYGGYYPGYWHHWGHYGSGFNPYHPDYLHDGGEGHYYGPRTTTTGGFGHRAGSSGGHSAVS